MSSVLAAPPALQGVQQPRVSCVPPCVASAGEEAVELAEMAGLHLDPWEAHVLRNSLGEREDGKWSAFEIGLMVSRQNGKGAILEARELAGLFLLGERLIIHSAHQFDTSLEHFRRLLSLIEGTPDLSRRVRRVSRSHGEEGIELKTGQRIRFRTRTKSGGRGFSGDCVIFDEAMELAESAHGAILPTLSASSVMGSPQVWYTGSAVDQWTHENGVVFARIRERGLAGDDPSLAYFEWSVEADNPETIPDDLVGDVEAWAQANPGLGIRISAEHIDRERRSMDARTFAVERLGVGDWPRTDGQTGVHVVAPEVWAACIDVASEAQDPVAFAFDVSPDRSTTSIGVAGKRDDGVSHVEVVERKRGTGWVVERLVGLAAAHAADVIICDGAGPAASLIAPLKRALKDAGLQVEVVVVNAKEHAQACGVFYDATDQGALRHLDTPELNAAVDGARQRPLGEAWAWSRKSSGVDITPLVAVTLALWGCAGSGPESGDSVYEHQDLLVLD